MHNCPDSFYLNCCYAGVQCKSCCAGTGPPTSKLKYVAIKSDNDLATHPYTQEAKELKAEATKKPKKDKAISNRIKKALKKEFTVLNTVANKAGLKFYPTERSGAKDSNGDGQIGPSSIDHKYRTNSRTFTVTKAEYEKGLAQNVNTWAITVQNIGKADETVFVLTEDLYVELMAYVNHANQAIN